MVQYDIKIWLDKRHGFKPLLCNLHVCFPFTLKHESFDAREYEFKNTKIKNVKMQREFGQLCLYPRMRENISTILENTENKI